MLRAAALFSLLGASLVAGQSTALEAWLLRGENGSYVGSVVSVHKSLTTLVVDCKDKDDCGWIYAGATITQGPTTLSMQYTNTGGQIRQVASSVSLLVSLGKVINDHGLTLRVFFLQHPKRPMRIQHSSKQKRGCLLRKSCFKQQVNIGIHSRGEDSGLLQGEVENRGHHRRRGQAAHRCDGAHHHCSDRD